MADRCRRPRGAVWDWGLAAGCVKRCTPTIARWPTTTRDGARRVFVHLCSAAQWTAITGEVPPPTSVDRDTYVEAGLLLVRLLRRRRAGPRTVQDLVERQERRQKLGTKEDPFVPIDPKTVVTIGG